jgi:hypothetical protein
MTRRKRILKKERPRIEAPHGSSASSVGFFNRWGSQKTDYLFEIRTPNKTTLKAFEETDEGKGIVRCKDEAELFKALGI